MKREFLKNFKVGEAPLPDEVIDAIMAENGNDIEATKKPFADYDTIKSQLATAQETIKGLEGQDIEGVRRSAQEWEQKYNQAIADHNQQMADRDFADNLGEAIKAAKGKNVKAITALLDVDTLKASKNQAADIKAALEALTKAEDSAMLFGDVQTPPPFAGGTGGQPYGNEGTGDFNFSFAGVRAKPNAGK